MRALKQSLLGIILLGASLVMIAQEEPLTTLLDYSDLEKNSPFLPPDYKPRGSGKPNAPAKPARALELTGMLEIDGQWSFSFYDPAKKQSFWVKMGDPSAQVKVVEVDSQKRSVVIESAGGRETVAVKAPAAPTGKAFQPGAGGPPSQSSKPATTKPKAAPNDLPPLTPDEEATLKLLEELLLGDLGGSPSKPRK